jgi:hypothetical protein
VTLSDAVGDLRDYLAASVSPAPGLVGIVSPTQAGDLPALRIGVREVTQRLRGTGGVPVQAMTGALPVTADIDLADPTLSFPDGDADLLSADRTTLHLPHGPVVRADGTATDGPWAAADLRVTVNGADRPVVPGAPSGQQAQVLPDVAALVFAAALPATGSVHVSYHVGQWDVTAERYQGLVDIDVYAADATALLTMRHAVEQALSDGPAGALVMPVAAGSAGAPDVNDPHALVATSTFSFDYERTVPRLPTGGGVIARIEVRPDVDTSFTVPVGT